MERISKEASREWNGMRPVRVHISLLTGSAWRNGRCMNLKQSIWEMSVTGPWNCFRKRRRRRAAGQYCQKKKEKSWSMQVWKKRLQIMAILYYTVRQEMNRWSCAWSRCWREQYGHLRTSWKPGTLCRRHMNYVSSEERLTALIYVRRKSRYMSKLWITRPEVRHLMWLHCIMAYNYSLWSIWMQQSNFRKSAIRIRR